MRFNKGPASSYSPSITVAVLALTGLGGWFFVAGPMLAGLHVPPMPGVTVAFAFIAAASYVAAVSILTALDGGRRRAIAVICALGSALGLTSLVRGVALSSFASGWSANSPAVLVLWPNVYALPLVALAYVTLRNDPRRPAFGPFLAPAGGLLLGVVGLACMGVTHARVGAPDDLHLAVAIAALLGLHGLAISCLIRSGALRADRIAGALLVSLAAGMGALLTVPYTAAPDAAARLAWRLFYLVPPIALLIASIRSVIGRATDEFQAQAASLRARALDQALNAAVEASLVKSRFVATVSHEIRTPLAGILGIAELLASSELDPQQRHLMRGLLASANSLNELVNDLLDLARVESGRLELHETTTDLRELCESITTSFSEEARRKGILLVAAVDAQVPPSVRIDALRLRQILTNFVSNAVRFTDHGYVHLAVDVQDSDDATVTLRFAVRDTGIGITPDAQRRIFHAFTQADASTSERFGGTGLGLSIVRQLAEIMGASVDLSSLPGAGSTFSITLQVARERRERPRAAAPRARVLLYAADDGVREALRARAVASGATVEAHASPGATIAAARAAQLDERALDFFIVAGGPHDDAVGVALAVRDVTRGSTPRCVYVGPDAEALAALQGSPFSAVAAGEAADSLLNDLITGRSRTRLAGRGLPILLAEDNEINRDLLVAQLARLGYPSTAVRNGVEALDALERAPYAVALLDAHMPAMDGYECARRIRAEGERYGRLALVAVSATTTQAHRDACRAAGIDHVLTKPVRLDDLSALLERLLCDAPALEPAARARLREIVGDDERVDAFIARAIASLHGAFDEAVAAAGAGRIAELPEIAHRMKGVAREIGASQIASVLLAFESPGIQTTPDLEPLFAELAAAIARLDEAPVRA